MADLGTAISCTTDTDRRMVYVSSRRVLAEAVFRRLITPRGGLTYDPDYGTDVEAWLHGEITRASRDQIKAEIEAEALKDPRVASATAEVEVSTASRSMTITLTIDDGDGQFDLVMAVSSVTAELLRIEGET